MARRNLHGEKKKTTTSKWGLQSRRAAGYPSFTWTKHPLQSHSLSWQILKSALCSETEWLLSFPLLQLSFTKVSLLVLTDTRTDRHVMKLIINLQRRDRAGEEEATFTSQQKEEERASWWSSYESANTLVRYNLCERWRDRKEREEIRNEINKLSSSWIPVC